MCLYAGKLGGWPLLMFAILPVLWLSSVGAVERPAESTSRLIEPGIRVGPVRPNTREVDLVRLLGRKNVRRDIWTGPEGDKQPATVLFPGTDSEAWVFWKNDAYKIPADVLIPRRGRSWRTAEGIHIGATLDTLVSLNGKHFRISGFFWDYGGTVRSWEGGQLDRFDPKLTVRLYPTADLATLPDSDIDAISGESAIVFSDTPALQRMNITVVELIVYLEDRWR